MYELLNGLRWGMRCALSHRRERRLPQLDRCWKSAKYREDWCAHSPAPILAIFFQSKRRLQDTSQNALSICVPSIFQSVLHSIWANISFRSKSHYVPSALALDLRSSLLSFRIWKRKRKRKRNENENENENESEKWNDGMRPRGSDDSQWSRKKI